MSHNDPRQVFFLPPSFQLIFFPPPLPYQLCNYLAVLVCPLQTGPMEGGAIDQYTVLIHTGMYRYVPQVYVPNMCVCVSWW